MTISGCSKGNDGGGLLHANFDAVNASAFADYATQVIRHFHEVWNVTFTSYAPFNEPSGLLENGGWYGTKQSQEGCCMTLPVMAEVVKAMRVEIQKKNMTYVRLTIADETQVNQALTTQEYFHEHNLSHLAEKVNVHGYHDIGALKRDSLYTRTQRYGHRLWMNEMGWTESPQEDVTQGLSIARRIVTDIRKMLPSAWVYWQAMANADVGAWGLLSVPFANPAKENIRYNSGFYAMKQFSKFIKKGSVFVQISNVDAVASYHEENRSLVIVIVNDEEEDSAIGTYNLALFTVPSTISGTRTSKAENNVDIVPPSLNLFTAIGPGAFFTYAAPPRSVTTLVLKDILKKSSIENEFHNGNFEGGNEFWTVRGGTTKNKNGGSSLPHPFRGDFSGFVDSSLSDTEISQALVVPGNSNETVSYYLTAWCKTGGALTVLGVVVNGDRRKEIPVVNAVVTYQSFALSFQASAGDLVSIYFAAKKYAFGISYVDDITLVKAT